ncbi:MAG: cyclase family protein [Dehalococcoidia bacterium]
MTEERRIPRYDELPAIELTGDRHAWHVWGEGDQLGTINFLTPERVAAAARLVRQGRVISLNLPLDQPYPSLMDDSGRKRFVHHQYVNRGGRDDSLDGFYLQFSSQWDGLKHIRYREFGYYGGLQDADLDDRGLLGIEHQSRHGIVGRGVLLDLPRHLARRGTPLTPRTRVPVDGALLEEIAAAQGVAFQPGDILLLRTGFLAWWQSLDQPERDALHGTLHPNEGGIEWAGLDAHRETAAWLWDHQVASVCADNPSVEALRVEREVGFQHRRLIALLGMPLGEFWDLEALAADCAQDGVYEFMLTGAPLNLPGGVGSRANAYAIK